MQGMILKNRYLLKRLIGKGSMAVVYEAEDSRLHRTVAVKLLHPEHCYNADIINRFTIEAQATARLSHENIVQLFDLGVEGEQYYLVIEYVEGKTLKEYIRELGHLSMQETVEIGIQICDALIHAHDNGILHRDIKPQNILWYQYGHVKVADFGLARFSHSDTLHTEPGAIMGSIHYLSPEQLEGTKYYDSSDLYSLGIILYECLTGHPPFDSQNGLEIALKHLQEPTPSLLTTRPDLPAELDQLIQRATAKSPENRFFTAREMKQALENVRNIILQSEWKQEPTENSSLPAIAPNGLQETTKKQNRRKNKRFPLLWLTLGLISIGVGLWYLQSNTEEQIKNQAGQPNSNPQQIVQRNPYNIGPTNSDQKLLNLRHVSPLMIEKEKKEKEKPKEPLTFILVYGDSFEEKEKAQLQVEEIEKKTGITPEIEEASVKGKTYYRVKIGQFRDKEKAFQQQKILQENGFESWSTTTTVKPTN